MKLSQIVPEGIYAIQGNLNTNITGLAINSKDVKSGDMFVAIKGAQADGHQFILEAIENGARAVLLEDSSRLEEIPGSVTVLKSDNTHRDLGEVAARFYGEPAKKLKLIGVTGTKGKTSTVEMIRSLLVRDGKSTGVIDTLGIKYNSDDYIITVNTTPDSLTIQKTLKDMLDNGIEYVIIEVSSQAFKLYRTVGLQFQVGVFLNIDDDHISPTEHHSFEEYLNCKLKLFDQSDKVIVNKSDKIWNYLSESTKKQAITFSTHDETADYYSRDIELFKANQRLCSRFTLGGALEGRVVLAVPGEFNIANSLAALAVCHQLGVPVENLLETLNEIRLEGRVELHKLALETGRTILHDFAHNRISSESVLASLREYHPKRLFCIFSVLHFETPLRFYNMGYNAGKYADLAILTTGTLGDNSFEEVNKDVIRGLEDSKGKFLVIPDRKEAYKYALRNLEKDDILLLMNSADHFTGGKELLEADFLEECLRELPVLT